MKWESRGLELHNANGGFDRISGGVMLRVAKLNGEWTACVGTHSCASYGNGTTPEEAMYNADTAAQIMAEALEEKANE